MKNILILFLLFLACCHSQEKKKTPNNSRNKNLTVNYDTIQFTDGFDFPVGIPNGTGYYNAQNFTENNHLGEDWNGIGGGNTDMEDPIYSIANGYVSFSENIGGGWGNVIRITHYIDSNRQIESLYAHCNEISVKVGDFVNRGIQIGTIGTNNGMYWAHLHFEIRDIMNLPIGGGYSNITEGYLDPTKFINNNRN
jgi:murein DD-endopeptidase MepM/ murein hydrolase activator NlpD